MRVPMPIVSRCNNKGGGVVERRGSPARSHLVCQFNNFLILLYHGFIVLESYWFIFV